MGDWLSERNRSELGSQLKSLFEAGLIIEYGLSELGTLSFIFLQRIVQGKILLRVSSTPGRVHMGVWNAETRETEPKDLPGDESLGLG